MGMQPHWAISMLTSPYVWHAAEEQETYENIKEGKLSDGDGRKTVGYACLTRILKHFL
jgi:hypothetical protein